MSYYNREMFMEKESTKNEIRKLVPGSFVFIEN